MVQQPLTRAPISPSHGFSSPSSQFAKTHSSSRAAFSFLSFLSPLRKRQNSLSLPSAAASHSVGSVGVCSRQTTSQLVGHCFGWRRRGRRRRRRSARRCSPVPAALWRRSEGTNARYEIPGMAGPGIAAGMHRLGFSGRIKFSHQFVNNQKYQKTPA